MKRKKAKWLTVFALTAMLSISPDTFMESYAEGNRDMEEVKKVWDFSDGVQGWRYDNSWSGDGYTGAGGCQWDEGKQMLRVDVDYTKNQNNGWSQTGISISDGGGIDYSEYQVLCFDLYFDTAAFTTGQLTFKAESGGVFQDQMSNMYQAPVEDAGGTLRKVTLTMSCDAAAAKTEKPQGLMLLIIGNNTDYCGNLWFDNIKLTNIKEEKYLADTTVRPQSETKAGSDGQKLTVNGETISYAEEIILVDSQADDSVVNLYQYLKAIGESGAALYGHMEDTVLKAGSAKLSNSDTKDATGSLPAIIGLDCGELFRGFASKYNGRYPGADLEDSNQGNIEAAVRFSNEAIREGAIITLSAHIPNFSGVPKKDGEFEHSYDGYDYLVTDSYDLTGNAMNQILPGGAYHDQFRAYLDMVSDYAGQVDGPILFRPWHENTGSWFWWGRAFCDAETYKSVYKYTVEYLRDERGVHNLLYLYGPGSEASTLEEYGERYPGDEYVDMVGFDTYDNSPVSDEEGYTFQKSFEEVTRLTDAFAKQHGKLFAVTETGISSEKGGLPETGNKRMEWFTEILNILTKPEYDCCYFMTWSNYSRSGNYYSPFVEDVNADGSFFGHEMLDAFIAFYNNKKSVFAADQLSVMEAVNGGKLEKPKMTLWQSPSGYIVSPISGGRVLKPSMVTARVNQENADVAIRISGGGKELELETAVAGKEVQGVLDQAALDAIGQAADGTIMLYAGDAKLQEITVIFNIEPRPDDPYLVDDFESYAGLETLLNGSWAVNKDNGCILEVIPTKEYSYDGEYSMKFDYQETKNGWAGCVLSKEANWSGCNALQFMVVPDGNNQKTVVQINTADGGAYEAYLQEYPEYAKAAGPLLVTLPFAEFKDKNGGGALADISAASVTSIGFWLNAIPDSAVMKDQEMVNGTLYYDAVRAGFVQDVEPTFEKLDVTVKNEVAETEKETEIEEAGASVAERGFPAAPALYGAAALLSLAGLILLAVKGKKKQ